MIKLTDILNEIKCWDGYKPGNPKTKISSKTNKRVNNCVPIKEEEISKPAPYMYSPVGFSCAVCKLQSYNKDEAKYTCASPNYQKHMGTHFLINPETKEPITKEYLNKYCSNWFLPINK
jgi:hypothetical protein